MDPSNPITIGLAGFMITIAAGGVGIFIWFRRQLDEMRDSVLKAIHESRSIRRERSRSAISPFTFGDLRVHVPDLGVHHGDLAVHDLCPQRSRHHIFGVVADDGAGAERQGVTGFLGR